MPYNLYTPKLRLDWALQTRGVEAFKMWLHLGDRVSGFHPTPARVPATYFSLLARRRYSPTVIAFFWMLYCVKRPDWPVTTCWMGAGMTTSSMSSYVCRGFHSFGGMICETKEKSAVPPDRHFHSGQGNDQRQWARAFDRNPLPTPGRPAATTWEAHLGLPHKGTRNHLYLYQAPK